MKNKKKVYLKNHFDFTRKFIRQSYKLFHGIAPIFSDYKDNWHIGKLDTLKMTRKKIKMNERELTKT